MAASADGSTYEGYESRLIQLHDLIATGKGDSDTADALRDSMDDLYQQLSEAERERAERRSQQLYQRRLRVVHLDEDVSKDFATSRDVNEALRRYKQIQGS